MFVEVNQFFQKPHPTLPEGEGFHVEPLYLLYDTPSPLGRVGVGLFKSFSNFYTKFST
jgi:hypothetical protein